MFKVGDKVRIVKKSEIVVAWVKGMDNNIGKIGTITWVSGKHYYKHYNVKIDNNAGYDYDTESLESLRKLKLERVLKCSK